MVNGEEFDIETHEEEAGHPSADDSGFNDPFKVMPMEDVQQGRRYVAEQVLELAANRPDLQPDAIVAMMVLVDAFIMDGGAAIEKLMAQDGAGVLDGVIERAIDQAVDDLQGFPPIPSGEIQPTG